ncbi:MAG: DNA-directed RNA polymerase subunit N [Metallosphaera yellowstonensis]|jgi:DNA-directed RNA polymerase subunit N|uniref:DNA-directed RNA polymerase subunit Rpo10 n=1 Tax=Metallosphaera yellowstonensis MK1 TaxID=671065 RepID=H2C8S9_9CREN|nr:DNA-directed RNA polymerase subunit N [Metallosphaera yellowstonensis]EHP68555.1 DNA-directed RNA polymerase, subunit N (RpoN/RPB10) [Metallosphaera yellowstonensis MK1]
MIIPIRCFTCGSLLADKWEIYSTRVGAGEDPGKVLDDLKVRKLCCRRTLLTHVDIIREVVNYTRPI